MSCPTCGNQLRPLAKFCGICGRAIQSSVTPQVSQERRRPAPTARRWSTGLAVVGFVFALVVAAAGGYWAFRPAPVALEVGASQTSAPASPTALAESGPAKTYGLTRSEALRLVQNSPAFKLATSSITFPVLTQCAEMRGFVRTEGELTNLLPQGTVYAYGVFLTDLGLKHFVPTTATAPGSPTATALHRIPQSFNVHLRAPFKIVNVTGIEGAGDVRRVQLIWQLPLDLLGDTLCVTSAGAQGLSSHGSAVAVVTLFDDGWRVERVELR